MGTWAILSQSSGYHPTSTHHGFGSDYFLFFFHSHAFSSPFLSVSLLQYVVLTQIRGHIHNRLSTPLPVKVRAFVYISSLVDARLISDYCYVSPVGCLRRGTFFWGGGKACFGAWQNIFILARTVRSVKGSNRGLLLLRGTIVYRTTGYAKTNRGIYFPICSNNMWFYLLPGMVHRNINSIFGGKVDPWEKL